MASSSIYRLIAIAVDEYADDRLVNLNNAKKDIETIVALLTSKYRFDEIKLITNPEEINRRYIYNYLFNVFEKAVTDHSILILFAGHGEYNEKLNLTFWQ